LRRSKRVPLVRKAVRVKGVLAAGAIAIAGVAVADAAREAVREVTAVATRAAGADAEEGRMVLGRARIHSLPKNSRKDSRPRLSSERSSPSWEGHGFSRAAQS